MDKHFRLKNLANGKLVTLTQSSISIGRGPYNYVQVNSELLSSQHASIRINGFKAYVEDLKSTNGTAVNGMPITKETELMHGDVIGLGGEKFMLISPEKEDDVTLFSLNAGNLTMAPESKIAALNSGTLSADETKTIIEKILQHSLSQRSESFTTTSAVLIALPSTTIGSTFEFCTSADGVNRWFLGRDESFSASIDHPTVSVNHATLSFVEGIWKIKDNGSTNGTKVNGKRIVESQCKNGDLIALGKLNCVFGVVDKELEAVS